MTMFVVVGEALVDLVGQRGGRTFAAHPGGSPANVALGLARLGNRVTLKTRVGRDAFGAMIREHLEASGVVVDAGPDDDASSTTLPAATPIDLVDTVGAGDSFTSGLLDGLRRADLIGGPRREALAAIDQATFEDVVADAARIAGITCSRPGADPPTRAQLDAAAVAAH